MEFTKYQEKGSMHWDEMETKSIYKFNAYQQARYEIVLVWLGDIKGKQLVDFGCGDGALSYLLAKKEAEVTGIDDCKLGIHLAKENFFKKRIKGNFLIRDAACTSLGTNFFDIAIASEIIEHVNDAQKLICEACRILKSKGIFIITTPYKITEKPGLFHIKEFYPSELVALLKEEFDNIEVKETHHIMWYSLYTYHVAWFKWLINILTLWFGYNPFLTDSTKRTKRDAYTQISIKCIKK
ncbi:MAG: hypothetical protein A2Z91_06335 [Deltaproteobacteria bacterium GWA2_38_16]|nr:MAG: hypothetical protein A2Z91_06335 [Deltaproteobacteria bacterium GWA2_38_16]OGQ03682.1 MAG: hypothetical protein A3D19_02445 [Deltaproteobacteria bacterium RIFCSPHIGHO2_02_FULL_38_15]